MDYVIVCVTALAASALTLFSGFGLGTLLLPAFALLFPVELAVSATAIVHLLNNLFKLALVGRHASRALVLRFGLPAAGLAFAGAWLLSRLTSLPVLASYELAGRPCNVTPIKLVIAALILVFAVVDLVPAADRLAFPRRWIPLGGAISGFFGGLSGHQGALRSAFLINAGLDTAAFVGTGVACAVLVDVSRVAVYGASFFTTHVGALERQTYPLLLAATVAAFIGAFVGVRLMGKVALPALRRGVGALLIALALAMGAGVI